MKHIILGMVAAATMGTAAQAATVFGVDENNNLVTFSSVTPGTIASSVTINGTTATFLALDFRGSNGQLYGLADDLRLYTINTTTGLASAIGGPLAITGSNFGFDFNEAVDMIRVVSNDDSNYVVNPNTGVATRFTDVFYGAGDPNAGINPTISGNAYLRGTPNQFAIDTTGDFLVRQANNLGTLTTVGSLGVAVGPRTAFDIDTDGTAYLFDANRFYTVSTTTGAATLVGNSGRAIFGIAVQAVPEPGTWAMMILGFGAVGGAMRRRSASARASRMTLTYA
jgi:hypothetical protein